MKEYDPSGVNVGMAAPGAGVGHPFELEVPTLIDDGGANDNRCMVDGLLMNCEQVQVLLGSEVASQCNNNDCGPRMVRGRLSPLTTNPHTGELGYGHWERVGFKSRDPYTDEVLTSDGGQARFIMDAVVETDSLSSIFMLGLMPQHLALAPLTGKNLKKYIKQRDVVRDRLQNSDQCRSFLADHGIDPDAALDAINQQRAYHWPNQVSVVAKWALSTLVIRTSRKCSASS